MDESRFQLLKSIGFVASFGLVYLIQGLLPYRRANRFVGRNWRQNVPLSILNTVVLAMLCGACMCTAARFAGQRGLGLFHLLRPPAWLAAAATVVALDLALWAWHMANHRLRWLWRFHQVHHSDPDFDLSTSLRFHTGELLFSLPPKLCVVVALGTPILGLLAFEMGFGLFNLFVHGNIRFPVRSEIWASRLLVLPAAHRLHHSVSPDEHQRNFGTIFSLWDRWFGTWQPGLSSAAIRTGLPRFEGLAEVGLWRCLAMPFEPQAAPDAPPR